MCWPYHCGFLHQYLQSLNSHLCALRPAHAGCGSLFAVPALWGRKKTWCPYLSILCWVVDSILANICAHQLTLPPLHVATQDVSFGILLGAQLGCFVAVSSIWSLFISYLLFHLLLGIMKENIQHLVKNSLELPPDITLWDLSVQRISWFNKKGNNH